ncbi:MAG: hypothetical protein OQL08_01545 [Gammaproteobacteria bacterium]|nr:hypothetical protein [Gammaproteobacteria bacterium]
MSYRSLRRIIRQAEAAETPKPTPKKATAPRKKAAKKRAARKKR